MKRVKLNILKSLILMGIGLLLTNCELKIQPQFEFDTGLDPIPEFNMTAWEWIQTRTSHDTLLAKGEYNGDEFDLLKEAILLCGMVDEFDKAGKDKTFILLNNNAFTGAGDIIQLVTGSAVGDIANADTRILGNVLKYHIIPDEYITQNDPLVVYGVDHMFQTLLPGPDGEMSIRRNERLQLFYNYSPDLPSTKADEAGYRHNYVFTNGIGHIIQDYLRKVPFV